MFRLSQFIIDGGFYCAFIILLLTGVVSCSDDDPIETPNMEMGILFN